MPKLLMVVVLRDAIATIIIKTKFVLLILSELTTTNESCGVGEWTTSWNSFSLIMSWSRACSFAVSLISRQSNILHHYIIINSSLPQLDIGLLHRSSVSVGNGLRASWIRGFNKVICPSSWSTSYNALVIRGIHCVVNLTLERIFVIY